MLPEYLLRPLAFVCERCYRLPKADGHGWCALCLRKLAIVAEYDQREAEDQQTEGWKA